MVIFKSSCSINVRYFPFDEQNCSMTFASWTYDGYQINLVLNTHEGDISNYIPNSEWHLHKLYVQRNVVFYSCCAEPYPDITFYIHIQRRPLFYVFNMVMPCIMITLVALLGFYIPSDSGKYNNAFRLPYFYCYFNPIAYYLPKRIIWIKGTFQWLINFNSMQLIPVTYRHSVLKMIETKEFVYRYFARP